MAEKMILLKRRNRAQANIIVIVLIVLLVLAAIIIVWNVVRKTVQTSSEATGIGGLKVGLEIEEVLGVDGMNVKVKRSVGKGEISELRFILEDTNGQIYTETINTDLPQELETKTYNVFNSLGVVDAKKISVAPVVGGRIRISAKKDIDTFLVTGTGIVSWWKFDGNAEDSVGGNDGNLIGDAKIVNNELVLDGGGYVDAGNGASLDVPNQITISMWGKRDFLEGVGMTPVSKKNSESSTTGYMFEWYQSNIQIYWGNGTSNTGGSIGVSFANNTWYHMVVTINQGTATAYINGNLVGSVSGSSTIATTSTNLQIGMEGGGGRPFNGTIDDVMIFNRSLSEEEIKAIYNNQKK